MRVCSTEGCGRPSDTKGLCRNCTAKLPENKIKRNAKLREKYANGAKAVVNAKGKAWREANREKLREAYTLKNSTPEGKAANAARARAWREANREKHREYARDYYAAHPEKVKENALNWCRENPERKLATQQKRRTKKTEAGGSFTGVEWLALLEEFGHKCPACGKGGKMTADHILPVAWGGPSFIWNIQPLCHSCNCRKHDTMLIAYRPWGAL